MILDEYSKFKVVNLSRAGNEAQEKFQEFIAKHGFPEVLRSDNGNDFTRKHFQQYCIEDKTKQEFTAPQTPE